jgi:hypothetical protein
VSRRPVVVLAVAGALVLAACAGDGGDKASGKLAPPEGSFCDVVLKWSDAEVGTINHFSLTSPDAADVQARRDLYLAAWDVLAKLSAWVDAAADRAPEAARAGIHAAADRVRQELDLGRDHATALADDNYTFAAVRDGTLFTSTEKTRSVVYRALDNLRADLGEDVVPVACGRHTDPVTLPVLTAP